MRSVVSGLISDDGGAVVFGGMRGVGRGHDRSGTTDCGQHQVAGLGQFKGGFIGGQRNLFAKKTISGLMRPSQGQSRGT